MTHATEKVRAGREPCFLCEMDLDYCSKTFNTGEDSNTVAEYNKNRARQSETFLTTWTTTGCNVSADAVTTPPTGANQLFDVFGDGVAGGEYISIVVPAGILSTNAIHNLSCMVKEDTAADMTLVLRDTTAGADRIRIDYQWVAGVLGVKASDVGVGDVSTGVGAGWYRPSGRSAVGVIDGTATHEIRLYPTEDVSVSANSTKMTAVQLTETTTVAEYQLTEARDGTSTNITLASNPLTVDEYVSGTAMINESDTHYPIVDNGTGYVRVTGDASGAGLNPIELSDSGSSGCLIGSEDECFNTFKTCRDTTYYVNSPLTYKFAQPRVGIPGTAGYISSLRNVTINTPTISRGEGLSIRGSATLTFQDHPHHDRGIDKYISTRSYTPEAQGTFWGKLRHRNPYYQNRVCRIKTGYVGATFDATNDFLTRTYLLDKIDGPDAQGRVTVTCKDALKPASDDRSQAPLASEGVLDADINAAVTSLTLSPSGAGDDYDATGTLRINGELMTYTTKVGDAISGITRGTNNTTASTHSEGDTVQQCLVYSAARLDTVLNDLLTTYGNVSATYITIADWTAEVDDWLASSQVDAVISEPTGVMKLVNEILEQYMIDMWWDDIDAQIRIKPLQPHSVAPDVLDDDDHFLKGTMQVTDEPSERLSRVWVYHTRFNPTEPLDEGRNYRITKVNIDTNAEGVNQFNEKRVKKIFSRWITLSGDALRLASRLLLARRDNPRTYRFKIDAANDYEIADVVSLDTTSVQDEDGSNLQTPVYIIGVTETEGPVAGHTLSVTALDHAFDGRYGRIAPNGTAEYGAASDAEKQRYAWVAENSAPQLDGDGAYLIV